MAETFGPAEVCAAVRIPRATFHSYIARRLIHSESQGAGRARKFSLEQIIQIAAMGQLIAGFGIHASAAADWSQAIKLPIAPRGDLLIVLDNGKAAVAHKEPDETLESVIEAHATELKLVESRYPTPFPLRCIVMDVSDLVAWVRDRLAHPDPTWSDGGPAIPERR
jgi:hypothetical protein